MTRFFVPQYWNNRRVNLQYRHNFLAIFNPNIHWPDWPIHCITHGWSFQVWKVNVEVLLTSILSNSHQRVSSPPKEVRFMYAYEKKTLLITWLSSLNKQYPYEFFCASLDFSPTLNSSSLVVISCKFRWINTIQILGRQIMFYRSIQEQTAGRWKARNYCHKKCGQLNCQIKLNKQGGTERESSSSAWKQRESVNMSSSFPSRNVSFSFLRQMKPTFVC